MNTLDFVILALATWRLSNMLVDEDGPWMVFEHLRLKAGLQPPAIPGLPRDTDPPGEMPGTLFTCVWCLSVWIALFFAALFLIEPQISVGLAIPFALSAISCLIDRWSKQ